jgi:hypothetical protein
MLGDPHGHHRQFLDLMTRRLAHPDAVALAERMPARTARRPVLNDVVDRPRRQQRPSPALVAGLAARLAPRRILRALGRRRRILTRRLRRVARRAPGLALKPGDALVLLGDALLKPRDLLIHPHQHRHDRLAALPEDRLRLSTLHTHEIRRRPLMSPDRLNAYGFATTRRVDP